MGLKDLFSNLLRETKEEAGQIKTQFGKAKKQVSKRREQLGKAKKHAGGLGKKMSGISEQYKRSKEGAILGAKSYLSFLDLQTEEMFGLDGLTTKRKKTKRRRR